MNEDVDLLKSVHTVPLNTHVLNEFLAINRFSKQEITKLNLRESLPLNPVSVEPVESIQARD